MLVQNLLDTAMELYNTVSVEAFNSPNAVDAIAVTLIVGGIVLILRRQRRLRRRLHRLQWGNMTREQREWFILQRLEDGLMDALMEMVHDGTINSHRERLLMAELAEGNVKFEGLKPRKNPKRGIQMRLKKRFGLKPANIPGDKPGVDKVDKTYVPNEEKPKSRYAK